MQKGHTQFIQGEAGDIELVLNHADKAGSCLVMVICHPHPLYGGTLTNKVVHILAKTAVHLGMHVVRFNFRGVGKSEGVHDHGSGETIDCLAVIEWARKEFSCEKVSLAGFSFGAYVALRVANKVSLHSLLTVSPPVNLYDCSALGEVEVPWAVIQGTVDEIVSFAEVERWVGSKQSSPVFVTQEADHFFNGKLNPLSEAVTGFWSDLMQAKKVFLK